MGEHVFEVGKIKRGGDLRGGEFQQEFPQRQTAGLRPEVPAGVGDGGERELDDALVRAEPAELLFIGHFLLERAEVGHDFLDATALQAACIKLGGLADEVVALAEREGETAAGAALVVG